MRMIWFAIAMTVAGVADAAPRKIRAVEGITEYRFDNGLSVLLFPDATQSTVTVNVTYLVGSRVEGYGETGMAHLLEHMMFKGTAKLRDIGKLLDAKGAEENASTWTDRTNYFETLPATRENLDWALDMEADRMIHSTLSQQDLSSEFSVVRSEFEKDENDALSILQERIVSTAYLWHNYGKSTIGSKADIERVPAAALRRFYEKYYQPDNAVLVVSGKFDNDAALATIGKTLGAIPRPARVLEPSYTVEPQQDGERTVTLRRNGDIFGVGVAYHTVGAADPRFPAVECALNLLTRQPTGRLYKKLVETKLASSIDGGQEQFRDPYVSIVSAEVRDGAQLPKVQQAIVGEMEGLGATKITDKEVERWRAQTLSSLELQMANSQHLAVLLSEFAALGDWRTLFAYKKRVGEITAADVQAVAKTFFKASNRTVGTFIPTKDADRAPLVETPDVAAVVSGIEGGDVKEQGEAFAATFENIEARTTRAKLAGGIAAAFLPKKTRGGRVQAQLVVHFGDEKALQNKAMVARVTAELLSRGTTKLSYEDLRDQEDLLRSRILLAGEAGTFYLRVETLRDKLPAVIDLAADMLTTPTFPAKQLELVKQEMIAQLEQERQDPAAVAGTVLAQLQSPWPPADPRYPASADEQIAALKRVTLADVKSFYAGYVGGGHMELAAVGDFDAAPLRTQIEKRFAGWTSKRPYARLASKVFGVAATTRSIDIKDKEMTQLAVGFDVPMRDTDPDYAAWLVVGHLLGGDSGSRVWMRIREKEGLSYGVYAWTFASSWDDGAGGFGAEAIVAPQNLAKVKASLVDEITKLSNGPVSPAELQAAKHGWLEQQDTRLSNDGYVLSLLAGQLEHDRTNDFPLALRAKIRALTTADVERVAKKYLRPERLIVVDVGDKSRGAAAGAVK